MSTFQMSGSTQIRPLGFSTGCLYKFMDSYSPEALDLLASQGLEAIEVMCTPIDKLNRLPDIIPLVKKFAVKSLHLPLKTKFRSDTVSREILLQLEEFYVEIGASLVVVHPEAVEDWKVFDFLAMNFAIENLDNRKPRWFNFEQFELFFDQHPDWQMVLDLNHCATYGDLEERADRYAGRFGDRIAEIHLSGCADNLGHCPLYEKDQKEIVACLAGTSCPIIIESPFDDASGFEKEIAYIKQHQ